MATKKITTPAKKTAAQKAVKQVNPGNRLVPVVAKNEDQVIEAAFDGVRRRPVVAINAEGKMVVCCRRTAAKNGWATEGTLFARNRTKLTVNAQGKLDKKTTAKKMAKKVSKEVAELLK